MTIDGVLIGRWCGSVAQSGGELQHLLHQDQRPRPPSSGRMARPEDPTSVAVYAWKGETLEEYWWCAQQH